MGLDMYWEYNKPRTFEGFDGKEHHAETSNLHYWRKHNALHGWFERLWEEKTPLEDQKGDFNCEPVEVDLHDLRRLREDIMAGRLEPTAGFFFGSTDYSDEEWAWVKRDAAEFIMKAHHAINDGYKVYYNSWW